jgi:hypothetical protein
MDRRCLKMLGDVGRDVEQSAEDCVERTSQKEAVAEQDHHEEEQKDIIPAPIPVKGLRHKKQRSLLMSLVSYVL